MNFQKQLSPQKIIYLKFQTNNSPIKIKKQYLQIIVSTSLNKNSFTLKKQYNYYNFKFLNLIINPKPKQTLHNPPPATIQYNS